MLFKGLIFGSLLSVALANANCDSNAWLQFGNIAINGRNVQGDFYITSGQNSGNLGQSDLVGAMNKCFFDNGACRADMNSGKFNCLVNNAWNSANWVGTGNVEFHCGNGIEGFGGFSCYDVKWDRT